MDYRPVARPVALAIGVCLATFANAQTAPSTGTSPQPSTGSPAQPSTAAPAQTAPAPAPGAQNAPASTQAGSGSDMQSGMKMANTASVAVRFVTVKPADFMATKLMGATVYNNQNESLGEVEDLVIDNGKTLSGVVVSVGGFLGLGESYVVLDPATIVLNDQNGTWRAFVDTTKDNLKSAPKFTYSKRK